MISKCANPGCLLKFRYLHEGKVFRVERGDPRIDTDDDQVRSVEYFWLCEPCSKTLKLVYEHGEVAVHPLYRQLPASTIAIKAMEVRRSA